MRWWTASLSPLGDSNYQRAMEIFLAQAEDTIVNYGVKPVGKIVGISLGVVQWSP